MSRFGAKIKKFLFLTTFFFSLKSGINFSGAGGSIDLSSPTALFSVDSLINLENGGNFKLSQANSSAIAASAADGIYFESGELFYKNSGVWLAKGSFFPKLTTGGTDKVRLFDNGSLYAAVTQNLPLQVLVASSATAQISGSITFSSPLSLADSTSTLEANIGATVGQNIELNGGTLRLLSDLKISADARIVGPGQIDLGGCRLLVSGEFPSGVSVIGSGSIVLYGDSAISSTLTVNCDNLLVSGDTRNLTFSSAGSFSVGQSCRVDFVDLNLRNVGATATFSLFDSATSPGVVVLNNTNLYLGATLMHSSGLILFKGLFSTIYGDDLAHVVISGSNTRMTVDAGVLTYSNIDDSPVLTYPFLPVLGGALIFENSGIFRVKSGAAESWIIDASLHNGSVLYRSDPVELNSSSVISIINPLQPTPASIEIDAGGQVWQIGKTSGPFFTIGPNTIVILKNVFLEGFDPSKFSVDATSVLKFGSYVGFGLVGDLDLAGHNLILLGNNRFVGHGNRLILPIDGCINFQTPGATISFEDINVYCRSSNPISLTSTSVMSICNSSFFIASVGLNFSLGSVLIKGITRFFTSDFLSRSTVSSIRFNSGGHFTVTSAANLELGPGISFIYDPDLSGDLTVAAQKRHFILADGSSTLKLDNASFSSPNIGFALDQGRIVITNGGLLNCSATLSQRVAELSNAVTVYVEKRAGLKLDGQFNYTP